MISSVKKRLLYPSATSIPKLKAISGILFASYVLNITLSSSASFFVSGLPGLYLTTLLLMDLELAKVLVNLFFSASIASLFF
jgi:hypothetical protein